MARKKKSKKAADTRGYSQGGVPSMVAKGSSKTTTSSSFSSKPPTHDDVNKTTIDLKQTSTSSTTDTAVTNNSSSSTAQSLSSSSPPATATYKKFHNKLSTITTTLLSLQFTFPQITAAVCALQYEITLESALDYLCLHLSSNELPNLFCDGGLMYDLVGGEDEEDGDGRRSRKLTVVKVDKSIVHPEGNSSSSSNGDDGEKEESGGAEENILIVPRQQQQEEEEDKALLEEEKQRIKEKEERKNWLLRQYEYEEDHDDDDNNDNIGCSNKEQSPSKTSHHRQQQQELSPEEIQLQTTQTKLQLLEEDLANDANNYMRSKVEMKQLRNEVKKLKQVVAGLERKVERMKAEERKRRNELEVMNREGEDGGEEEEEEEGGGGMMFDLFGNQNDDDDDDGNDVVGTNEQDSSPPSTTTAAATTTSTTKSLEDYTIPTGWTGTTPQKKLDELLKKQQLPRAKYTKLPMNSGFKLTLITMDNSTNKDIGSNTKKKKQQQKHQQTIAKQYEAKYCDFTKTSSLKDYLATIALYELDSTLPLHSVFPMPFRTLWLSWLNEEREMKVMEQKVVEEERRMQIDHLIGLIESMRIDKKREQGGANDDFGGEKKKGEVVSENSVNKGRDGIDDVVDDWEAEEVDDESPTPIATTTITNKAPTSAGMKLQKEFIHRTSTPAYQKMKEIRNTLPMSQYRQTILDTMATKEHRVMILQADTGAGKSTQCAQYILEQALLDGIGDTVNIICTQPRRVAATSVAERVADEMVDPLGNMVGYQIRMESKRSSRTKLLFCTTGVVLRRLQDDPNLKGVTHVIVDEVHERQQQTDVLLIVLRQLLRTTRPDLKVILMSATMDEKLFCSFFQGAPLVSVPGRTFPVNNYFLEDLLEATDHLIEESSRYALREDYRGEKTAMMVTTRSGERRKQMVDCHDNPLSMELDEDWYPGFKMSTRLSLWRANEEVINYDLVEDVLALLLVKKDYSALTPPEGADMSSSGSVLVFLPGLGEIKALAERLEGNRSFRSCDIIPMHSTLSSKDQRRAFIPAAPGRTKIILGTNICETSITLPDVVCVIDCGRVRQVVRNKRTGGSMLVQQWCAKSSCKQRAGRAGRVQPGMCLKLYSSHTAEHIMKAESEPELRRVPLEEVCMSILASGFSLNCQEFLNQAPQPPSSDSVRAAVEVLHQVGAVIADNEGERLTPLGLHLAKLPVDVRIGKMMIFGVLFCCIEPVLTIAASLSSKSPFLEFFNDDASAKAKQRQFFDSDSDFITYVRLWEAFSNNSGTTTAAKKFCRDNFLNFVALREIGDSRRQFVDLLCSIGFLDRSDVRKLKQSPFNRHAKKHELVHAVCAAGFYPNIARMDLSPTMSIESLWHKKERLYFHSKSVNSSKKRFQSSDRWIVFHEKFGSTYRTSVAKTAFIHPIVLCLFGGSVIVKHTQRLVVVDEWIEIKMAAQVGVFLRQIRSELDLLLQAAFEQSGTTQIEKMDHEIIEAVVSILSA
jgi:ATP-dependent RNA helicase DHX29